MKQKTHSGSKKRIRIRKSGTATVQKSCKNHLLTHKSKRQKKLNPSGGAVNPSRLTAMRRLLPGKLTLGATASKAMPDVTIKKS